MLGSVMVDVAIGMVFIFLMLSLVCSAVREAIEARLKTRSKHLLHGINELLGDTGLTKDLYQHPLVKGLYDGPYTGKFVDYTGHRFFSWIPALLGSLWQKNPLPSYIPSRTAALALLQIAPGAAKLAPDVATLRNALAAEAAKGASAGTDAEKAAARFAQALLAAISTAGNDVEQAVKALEQWFDASMERVSGWYKRESQHILFWLGLVVAVAMNVDTVFLIKYLTANDAARTRIVQAAEGAASSAKLAALVDREREEAAKPAGPGTNPSSASSGAAAAAKVARAAAGAGSAGVAASAPAVAASQPADDLAAQIKSADQAVDRAVRGVVDLNLPIGWSRARWNAFELWTAQGACTVLGWLLTAFGLSFGAPFWFDALNKLITLRSTIKPAANKPAADKPAKDG